MQTETQFKKKLLFEFQFHEIILQEPSCSFISRALLRRLSEACTRATSRSGEGSWGSGDWKVWFFHHFSMPVSPVRQQVFEISFSKKWIEKKDFGRKKECMRAISRSGEGYWGSGDWKVWFFITLARQYPQFDNKCLKYRVRKGVGFGRKKRRVYASYIQEWRGILRKRGLEGMIVHTLSSIQKLVVTEEKKERTPDMFRAGIRKDTCVLRILIAWYSILRLLYAFAVEHRWEKSTSRRSRNVCARSSKPSSNAICRSLQFIESPLPSFFPLLFSFLSLLSVSWIPSP